MSLPPKDTTNPQLVLEYQSRSGGDKEHTKTYQLLTLGFGTTVAMWLVGYVGHMPLTHLPGALFVSMMLVCVVFGGWAAGRYTQLKALSGFLVGIIAACLNLLILGSLLTHARTGQIVPQAWLWVPGTFLLSAALASIGAWIGGRNPKPNSINWTAAFAWVTAIAAFLLITAGGLVTGMRAGLAVPDWPNSYGSNMFLFPLTMMTGGAFYEHAHRLLGSLVGLTSLTLAITLTITHWRQKSVVLLIWLTGLAVLLQGILGGLRVTGNFTMAQSGPTLVPSNTLAVVHGFFAHCVLGGLVATAILLTRTWRERRGIELRLSASTDHFFTLALVLMIVLQTFIGTMVRQMDVLLLTHITLAVLVGLFSLAAGFRAWGLNPQNTLLRRIGVTLLLILTMQIIMGIIAVIVRTPPVDQSPSAASLAMSLNVLPVPPLHALLTTAHQSNAAILLSVAIMLALYTVRLRKQVPQNASATNLSPMPV